MAHYEDGRALPIDTLWDPQRCPAALLPWLAWALGVREWDAAWTPAVQRRVIGESVGLHRIEGTVAALRTLLDATGAVYDLVERPGGTPLTAAITIHNSAAVGAAALRRLRAQIDAVTRLSVDLTLTAHSGAGAEAGVAIGVAAITVAHFRVPVDVP